MSRYLFTCLLLLSTAACQRHRPAATTKFPEPFDSASRIGDYERARRSVDGSPIPYERYAAAHSKAKAMARRTLRGPFSETNPIQLTAWTNLGPANIAGMSRSLVIDPTNPDTMYTTGINGGVWKSLDGGSTWNALGDFLPVLVIGSLALAPQDSNTIYAGTGDGFIGYDSVRGAGIFKSTDAGNSWTRLNSDNRFTYVNKIVVSPNQINRVYAATNAGVLRSDDAGASWNVVLDRGFPHRGCHDLAIRTDLPQDALLASCGIPSPRSNGALLNKVDPREDGTLPATVFLNTDAANSDSPWTPVLTEPAMGRTSLAIAPSNQNIVYASASSNSGNFANALLAIFRSTDGGATWQATVRNSDSKAINRVLLGNPYSALCAGGDFTGQAWHDNAVAVDPTDPMRVWVAGVDVFRSDDGGANWGLASYWWANSASPQYSHADHHVLLFHPNYDGAGNQTLFDVNDGGVFRSDNSRSATSSSVCNVTGSIRWRLSSTDLVTLLFYHGSISPDGKTYFGGAQDNGTVIGTETGGPRRWNMIFGGDGGATAIDPGNPRTIYASSTDSAILKSTDGGNTFRSASSGIAESGANFFLIGTFVMDPRNASNLWTGGNTIWRTTNAAGSWTAASAPLVARSFGSFAVSPADSNVVMAGSRTGEIYRSTNALSTNNRSVWPMSMPRIGWVSALVFDPVNPSTAYAVYSSFNRDAGDAHIYKSSDGGVTWAASDGVGDTALPDAPYFTLVVNPDNPSNLWTAGDLGLFVSMDGGATWTVDTSGFPSVATNYLKIQRDPQGLALYAFTHGRGLWRGRIGAVTSSSTPASPVPAQSGRSQIR